MQLDINNDQHFLCRGSTLSLQRFNTFCESLVLFIISSISFHCDSQQKRNESLSLDGK